MSSAIAVARREPAAASLIPLSAHVDPCIARTAAGDYVQVLRLAGASFESAPDAQLNDWHLRLNALWRNLASPHVALWSHVVRRRDTGGPPGGFAPGFACDLHARYRDRLASQLLMANDLYLSVVWRPQPGAAGSLALGLLKRQDAADRLELADSLEACAKLRQELLAALARYDPEPLGLYRGPGERLFSSLLEFYGLLVNGEWQRLPLPRAPLADVVATSRVLIGREAIEYRTPVSSRLGAVLGIKEYPTPTVPGLLDALLTAPFSFVLTQSFAFLPKATAQELMARQLRRMHAAGDLALSQADELRLALDDLTSNRFVVGDHHLSLQVLTEPFDGVAADTAARLKSLNDRVAEARFLLGETGMVTAREDLALEAAFWAQLPGNFRFRPRKAPITSRNFAALAPLHNYPVGRRSGNHWGEALTMFVTSARSPLHFSLHASDPRGADGGSRRDVGHLAGIGPVGTGKTTLLGFLIAMLTRFDATQVVFDKDEGLHILVKALGGEYLSLKSGRPTGCNPLQMDAGADNVEFLQRWLRRLAQRHPDEVLSVRQQDDLDQALRGTLQLEPASRRLSRLVEFLDPTDPEGPHARLARWCRGGADAWAFDNADDRIVPLLDGRPIVGFDIGDFLDHPAVRDPLSMYLFHLVQRLVDGRRLVVWADEFARVLADASFADFARNGLESWRKKDAALAAFTQSAGHVLNSSVARAIVEQTPTKIFFPNPDADRDEYQGGFSLSEREFELVKHELEPGSRTFLVKQNHLSVVASLDLQGLDFELDVISGRTANVEVMRRLVEQHGPSPADWLPAFAEAMGRRRSAINASPMEMSHG